MYGAPNIAGPDDAPIPRAIEHMKPAAKIAAEDAEVAKALGALTAPFGELHKYIADDLSPSAIEESHAAWKAANPEYDAGFRDERANGKTRERYDDSLAAAKSVAASVQVVVEELREQSIPKAKLKPDAELLVRDEAKMLLEAASTDGAGLTSAMLRLLDDLDSGDPVIAVLAGRFGRSYAVSRGDVGAHEAFRAAIAARAAEHGQGRERVAARTLAALEATGLTAWADPDAAAALVRAQYSGASAEIRAAVGLA